MYTYFLLQENARFDEEREVVDKLFAEHDLTLRQADEEKLKAEEVRTVPADLYEMSTVLLSTG